MRKVKENENETATAMRKLTTRPEGRALRKTHSPREHATGSDTVSNARLARLTVDIENTAIDRSGNTTNRPRRKA
jgi:hypothetical protein